jgi:putative phosphoesterase
MARYGLISDTHGFFDPQLPEIFRGVELILHAGDVGDPKVLAGLRAIAPLVAVRGNNDRTGAPARLPLKKLVSLEKILTLLIHEVGKPERPLAPIERLLARHRPGLVIYGHSHLPADERRGGTRFINPGSAGKKRFRLPRICALLRIDGSSVVVQYLSLE